MIGYQAPGTLGSLLLIGKKAVRIQGEEIKVHAHIKRLDIYSGHADANELQEWVLNRLPIHRAVFLTHGEPGALEALQKRLIDAGLSPDHVLIPNLDDEYELTATTALKQRSGHKPRLAVVAAAKLDWHNDLAQLSLDIREELENAADEKSKQKILRRLRRALDNKGA